MATRPLVLLHGYAAQANTFDKWKAILQGFGFNLQKDIFIGNYVTLNNEITVDDISEGFDRALRAKKIADHMTSRSYPHVGIFGHDAGQMM